MNPAIGGIRCECGAMLETAQVIRRLISRIQSLEQDSFKHIGALQALGADQCGRCGDWFRDSKLIATGDRVCCERCFAWEWFVREDDEEETIDQVAPLLLKRVMGTPLAKCLPHDRDGSLAEPFKTYWRKVTA